jgi:hypothetical protein
MSTREMLNTDVKIIFCVVITMHVLSRGSEYRTLAKELTRRMETAGMSCFRVSGSDVADLSLVNIKPVNKQMSMQPLKKITKLRGRSPQANYTDRATAACRRS